MRCVLCVTFVYFVFLQISIFEMGSNVIKFKPQRTRSITANTASALCFAVPAVVK